MNTIITQNELNRLTHQELGELHQLLTLLLTQADPASQERRNILASLANTKRALTIADKLASSGAASVATVKLILK